MKLILVLFCILNIAAVGQEIRNIEYPPEREMAKFENMHEGGLLKFKVVKNNIKSTAINYQEAWRQARLNCGNKYVYAENDHWGDTRNKTKLMKQKYVALEYRCVKADR